MVLCRFSAHALLTVLATISVRVPLCPAQDLLNDEIGFSGLTLQLSPYAQLPSSFNDVISMTTVARETFVTTQEGRLFSLASPQAETSDRLEEVIDF